MTPSSFMRVIRSLEGVTQGVLLIILFGMPLAFGSIHRLAEGAVQTLSFLIFFLWEIRRGLILSLPPSLESFQEYRGWRQRFVVPFIFWFGLVALQLIPLKPVWLFHLSPQTHFIYDVVFGSMHQGFYSLTLSPFDTWQGLLGVCTWVILFYLIATASPYPSALNSPPKGGGGILFKASTPDRFFNLLLGVMALAAGFQAFYGLSEYLTGEQRIYFFPRSVSVGGAAGTFINPNHFANYLLISFPLLWAWAVLLIGSPASSEEHLRSFPAQRTMERAMVTVILSGVILAVAASHSRMALFCLLIETFLLVAFSPPPGSCKRGNLFLLAGGIGILIFLFFFDREFPSFQTKWLVFFRGLETGRLEFLKDGLAILRDFPWLGTGLGTFPLIFPKYSSLPVTFRLDHIHNEWLEVLVETGLLGFGLIAAAAVWFIIHYLRRLRWLPPKLRPFGLGILVSVLGFLIHSLVEFNFHIPANAYTFAILLGMGLRLDAMGGDES